MSLPSPGAPAPPAPITAPPVPAPPAVHQGRSWSLVLTLALAALCVAWELWLAPTGRGTLAIKALPLLLCLPGLWRHRLYTYRWMSLLVWLYVTEGLVRGTTEHGASQALALGEVALATVLFVAVVHYIRLRVPKRPKARPAT